MAIHDPQVLRAIAHPVRTRILTELDAGGSLRAADLAARLDIPANQASFHLRQLAKYGLVEEDPEAARDKRDRVWRPTSPGGYDVDVADLEREPGGAAAARVFMRTSAAFVHHVVDEAYGERRDPDTHRSSTQQAVRLTKDEAAELADEVAALLARWTERTRGRDGSRRTYLFHSMLLPHPDAPAGDAGDEA